MEDVLDVPVPIQLRGAARPPGGRHRRLARSVARRASHSCPGANCPQRRHAAGQAAAPCRRPHRQGEADDALSTAGSGRDGSFFQGPAQLPQPCLPALTPWHLRCGSLPQRVRRRLRAAMARVAAWLVTDFGRPARATRRHDDHRPAVSVSSAGTGRYRYGSIPGLVLVNVCPSSSAAQLDAGQLQPAAQPELAAV